MGHAGAGKPNTSGDYGKEILIVERPLIEQSKALQFEVSWLAVWPSLLCRPLECLQRQLPVFQQVPGTFRQPYDRHHRV